WPGTGAPLLMAAGAGVARDSTSCSLDAGETERTQLAGVSFAPAGRRLTETGALRQAEQASTEDAFTVPLTAANQEHALQRMRHHHAPASGLPWTPDGRKGKDAQLP